MTSVFDDLWRPVTRARGGWRQRLAADAAQSPVRQCHTVLRLLEDYSLGRISAIQVWRHMDDLRLDGFEHPAITRLHGIATHGTDANAQHNLQSILVAVLRMDTLISEVGGGCSISHVVKPSSLFTWLHAHDRRKWAQVFGADTARLSNFWAQLFSSTQGQQLKADHPYLRHHSVAEITHCIPCFIWDDAAPFSKKRSAQSLLWGSVLGTGLDFERIFLYCSEISIKGGDAMRAAGAWELLFADFDSLADGVKYVMGVDGIKWRLTLLFTEADNEQRVSWGFRDYRTAMICSECDCNRDDMPFTDLRDTADWRPTTTLHVTREAYLSRIRPGHPLAASKYLGRWMAPFDVMHVYDLHGITAVVLGSILTKLVADPRLGRNQQARLDFINGRRAEYYREHVVSSHVPTLLLQNLKLKGWGELTGQLIKAAGTRHLTPFVELLAVEFFSRENVQYDIAIVQTVVALNGIYAIIFNGDMFLSPSQKVRLREHMNRLGKYLMFCRQFAKDANELLFAIKPKAHYGQHLDEAAGLINPRAVMSYVGESKLGKIVKIWRMSVSGPYKRTVQKTVHVKHLVALAISWKL